MCVSNIHFMFHSLLGLGLSSEARLQTCQEIVEALPPLNREVLHYLFLFVKDVGYEHTHCVSTSRGGQK